MLGLTIDCRFSTFYLHFHNVHLCHLVYNETCDIVDFSLYVSAMFQHYMFMLAHHSYSFFMLKSGDGDIQVLTYINIRVL